MTTLGPEVSSTDGRPAAGAARPGRRSRWVTLLRVVAVLVAVVLVVFGGAAWYFSSALRSSALTVKPLHDTANVEVVAATGGVVTLVRTRSMSEAFAGDAVYGLDWGSGFGRIGRTTSAADGRATRELDALSGEAPSPGTTARLTRDAYPREPALLGFPVQQISYRSSAGTFPAYLSSGTSGTWAILVHGRGATRSEMFRLMVVTHGLGMPSMDIAYRHDPETGGGLVRYGQDEWRDLQAAVRYALDHGAERVVLAGTSMGAAISAAFLESSTLASRVSGVVLDSPMLDFGALIDFGARDKTLPVVGGPVPGLLVDAAKVLAGMRFGIDAGKVNYLDDTSWLTVPTLAFHGSEDPKVQPSQTTRLAAAEPDLVDDVIVPGARHVESWNTDPAAYETRVRQFLESVLAASPTR